MRVARAWALVPLLTASGCTALLSFGDVEFSDDGGTSSTDAGVDAGSDGGTQDGGPDDAGLVDAGPVDAGLLDAGLLDAGATDAGPDAGTDAGFDAGGMDAGRMDAGYDAGTDAGYDAGTDAGPPLICVGSDPGFLYEYPHWHVPTPASAGLAATTQSFSRMGDVIVEAVTGLEWQREPSMGTMNRADAVTYCAGLTVGGCSDWRLPSMIELASIVDLDRAGPTIDPTYFPFTPRASFWTNTERVGAAATEYWVVSFNYGEVNREEESTLHYARCVRDPVVRGGSSYSRGGDVVTFGDTGLSWQADGAPGTMSHAAARTYCAALVQGSESDWRLPTRTELQSIVDIYAYDPAIDTTTFDPVPAGVNFYWSDTIDASSGRPWFLAFREGGLTFADPITDAAVRCVRGP